MNYEQAVKEVENGNSATRKEWPEGSFIFYGIPFVEISIQTEGQSEQIVNASAHYNVPFKTTRIICKKTDVIEIGWNPTAGDRTGEDWKIFGEEN